ncbi:MAG TPA: DUF1028 domain-containing protein [Gaiellales bacterium]|nr:DUF1028 domain-containing protein [Gaiellales bacterium]
MTFSLLARCPRTGMLGMVVSSSSPAVAARCAHVAVGAGAAASQNVTDPRLGMRMVELMAAGASAPEAVERAVEEAGGTAEHRQLAAVDSEGGTAGFSGGCTLGLHAVAAAEGVVAAGNLLAAGAVVDAMVRCFEQLDRPQVHLGDRLVAGLVAGLEAGGEAGPVRSAGLLICDRVPWPVADLRVDWDDAPIGRLAELWGLWKPQLDDYVTRALDPAAAPRYGVAGDR